MPERRTLRSPRLRAALWYAFDGKCAWCGEPLAADWHADHIKPWSQTHTTNVHEMQPLCSPCNLRKGAMSFRKHQMEIMDIGKRILGGEDIRRLYVNVTPGGGKSALVPILANMLIPAVAEKVLWVVPRLNLRRQAEEAFGASFIRARFPTPVKAIAAVENAPNPTRGLAGYITTYQAIVANPDLHIQEIRRHPYIIVTDEPHHLKEGEAWPSRSPVSTMSRTANLLSR